MVHSLGKLSLFPIALAMFTAANAVAKTEAEIDDPDAPLDSERTPDSVVSDATTRHWQFSIALNAVSYQRASFDVEPKNSGRAFPGTLARTNLGPSGGSILIEPGYVFGTQLVVGMLLDIGSATNQLKVKGLGFKVTQTAASFAVGPRVAYFFAPKSRLQPFLTLAFGYTTTPSEQAAQTLKITEYQGFAGAGLSYFPQPSFSFDTSVRAAYGIGSGYVDSPPLEDASLSGSVFTVMWTIGTTGWLN